MRQTSLPAGASKSEMQVSITTLKGHATTSRSILRRDFSGLDIGASVVCFGGLVLGIYEADIGVPQLLALDCRSLLQVSVL